MAVAARRQVVIGPQGVDPRPKNGLPVQDAHNVGLTIQKEHKMSKEELLQFEGRVTEILPDARFRHKDERASSLSRPPQRHQFRRR